MDDKSVKKSVRLTAETVKTLRAVNKDPGMNWSGSINDLARNYRFFVEANLPELSDNELLAFQMTYNGYIPNPNIEEETRILPWNISEGWQYDEQIKNLFNEDEIADFLKKINGWGFSERLAVIYKAREFWAGKPISEED